MTPNLPLDQPQPIDPSQSIPNQQQGIYVSTHHLPTNPAPTRYPCLEFQHLSHRLTFWNSLHQHRTGAEYLFQNYYRESSVGPEILWALPALKSPEPTSTYKFQPDVSDSTEKRKREANQKTRRPTMIEAHAQDDDDEEDEHSGTPSLACSSLYGGPVSCSSDDGRHLARIPSPALIFQVHDPASKIMATQMGFKKRRVEW